METNNWPRGTRGRGLRAAGLVFFVLAMALWPVWGAAPAVWAQDTDPLLKPAAGQATRSSSPPNPTATPLPALSPLPVPFPHVKRNSGPVGTPSQAAFPAPHALPRRPAALLDGQKLFEEQFEGAFPGAAWTLYDGSDDGAERSWGKDDYRVHTGSGSAWVASGGTDGLDPEFYYYPNNLDSWMIAGPFSLADGAPADLEFYLWYDTDLNSDYLFAGVSTDGETFYGWTWTGMSGGWDRTGLDLAEYAGEPQVWIGFQFHSDGWRLIGRDGAWVDDVALWQAELPTGGDLIQNGGFETGGLAPWQNGGSAAQVRGDLAHGSQYAARLGGGNNLADKLYQRVQVPAEVQSANVRFWMSMNGQETLDGADTFCARLYTSLPADPLADRGAVDLGCADGLLRTGGWELVDYALGGDELDAVRGRDAWLYFYLETSATLPTEVWVDDVQFWASTGGGDGLEPNNSPDQATPLTSGTPVSGASIDPAGDRDWFSIAGQAGQKLAADLDAADQGSALDSVLWLVDASGETLATNDDYEGSYDSYLVHTLPADGPYYVVVGSYDDTGDRSYVYDLTVTVTGGDPPAPPEPPTPPEPPAAQKEWTAILYLDGDNNLYSWYAENLPNLEPVVQAKGALLEVLVLLDGPEQGDTVRYWVQPGGAYTDNVNRWRMGELNMGDPQTLVDFAQWAMQNFPAEHYYLSINDHGNGTWGIASDDTSGGDNITVRELYGALKAISANGEYPLDLLGYDACLMGLYENSYDVREFADYLFLFESISWACNTTYSSTFGGLTAGVSAEQLGRRLVDQYAQQVEGRPHVGALLDPSRLGALRGAVDALANALAGEVASNKATLTEARDAAQKFEVNGNNWIDTGDYYVDLWDLAGEVAAQFPGLAAQANGVKNAVDAAVLEKRVVSGWAIPVYWDHSHAHGLSIYWPQTASGSYAPYVNDELYSSTLDGRWDEFLEAYFGTGEGGLPLNPGLVEQPPATYRLFLPLSARKR